MARVFNFAPADDSGDTHRRLETAGCVRGPGHKVLLAPHLMASNVGGGLAPGSAWATRCGGRSAR